MAPDLDYQPEEMNEERKRINIQISNLEIN